MNLITKFKKIQHPKVLIHLGIIVSICISLIFINFYTIKILSGSRAYVNGESHYSKGQKEAVHYLITYLFTENESNWKRFKTELSVPQGDRNARIALTNHADTETIKNGFRAARNHEDDLNDMIWIFRNFHSIPFFKQAIEEWKQADYLVNNLNLLANEIREKVQSHQLNDESKQKYLSQLNELSERLSTREKNFSSTLGQGTRDIKKYLTLINIALILIIIFSVGSYILNTMRKLTQKNREIELKNHELTIANKELDKFVYSASHDLRSPIASLKGIVDVMKIEEDHQEFDMYLDMMYETLNKQDQFISDIIDYARNKRSQLNIEYVSLNGIIKDAITQHKFIDEAKNIHFIKNLEIDNVYGDRLRLKIVFNNLISNAIKYADLNKTQSHISIKTYLKNSHYIIEIEDNGIGIKQEYMHKIFDMFFVTNRNKGTGLGLYIIKDAIELMKGEISVESQIGHGTKFTISIPQSIDLKQNS